MMENKQRVSQTEPNSSMNLVSLDTQTIDNFYTCILELWREKVISDAQKKETKILLCNQDKELQQVLYLSKGSLVSMKDNLTRFIKSRFQFSSNLIKPIITHSGSFLEVQTMRNSSKSPSNITSQSKPELGSFLRYMEDLQANSPTKLTMFDKKLLQKIYKRLHTIVYDQCSPLAPERKSFTSSANILSTGNLSPVKCSFASEDIIHLYNTYKSIKSVYIDLLRLAQLFIQDNLSKIQTLNNITLLLKYLLNVDSFQFLSNPNGNTVSSQPAQQKRTKSEDDKFNGVALQSIRVSESIIQEAKSSKEQEWVSFDSSFSDNNENGFSFTSESLADEIQNLSANVVELSELDAQAFPTIVAKCSSYDEQYKTFLFKFYNQKSETYEILSLRYKNEESFHNDKTKIITNKLALPIYQNQAFTYLGQFVVNTIQNFNNLSECSFQIIDICNLFLNFGKNLLIDSFKNKLTSAFKISTTVNQIDTKKNKSQGADERSKLFQASYLILEDDYSDIVFESQNTETFLNDPALFAFFIEISHYYGKYRQFLFKVNQKVFVYKYFLRNSYSTFLDFSKKGELKFISHLKSNLEIDYNQILQGPLKIKDIFKGNKKFQQEFEEIIEYFQYSLEEQEKLNLKSHIDEELEKQRIQKAENQNINILPSTLQTNEEEPIIQLRRPPSQTETRNTSDPNSCLSPGINDKPINPSVSSNFNALSATGISNFTSNNNNNNNNININANNNNNSNNNKSFVSSASKSYRPFKSFIKKANSWFNLKSIPDSQIYVQIIQNRQKIVIQSIYLNIQDDFHSDSCTNFESFYQLDDILNSLNTSEFNDPRIKLVFKKLYSKINQISTEEKVQNEYTNTQIELFTNGHRERFTSTPASIQTKSAILNSTNNSKHSTTKIHSHKQQNIVSSPTTQETQKLTLQALRSILHSTPAVTNIDDWDFNVFELRSLEEKYTTAWNILKKTDFFESFLMPEEVFANFIKELQKGYDLKNNDFHNFNHGVSVMQSCYMLSKCRRAVQVLKKIDIFTVVLSGLCHDVGHTGRTNNFEIAVQSKLAIRYHDKSVLEQHHLATTFKIMKSSNEFNILQNLDAPTYSAVRRSMISNILYTDIKQHFKLKQDFETYWKTFDPLNQEVEKIPEGEIDLLTGMIIHTADFTGAAKPFWLSRQWSEKVNKEFHNQYIDEGKRGVEQTSFMKDLDILHVMAKAEKGFLNVIVLPLWVSLNDFYQSELNSQIVNLNDSIQQWGELSQQVPVPAANPPTTASIPPPPSVNASKENENGQLSESKCNTENDKSSENESEIKQVDSSSESEDEEQLEELKNIKDEFNDEKNRNEIIVEMVDQEESNEKLNTIICEPDQEFDSQQQSDSSPHQ